MPRWPRESQAQRIQKEQALRYILENIAMKKFRERLAKRPPAYITYQEMLTFLNLKTG